MGEENLQETVRAAIDAVRHPEIDHTLAELGMIRDVRIDGEKVSLVMALPFLEIPIKEDLVRSLVEAVKSRAEDWETEVSFTVMNQEERERFLAMARSAWML